MNRFLVMAFLALIGSWSCTPRKGISEFARVENARFVIPHAPSRFVGTNFWYGALLATEGPSCDRDRLCRELDRLKAAGITNLRILVGSEGNEGVISKVEPILQTAPGVYNDKALDGLDFLMAELGKREMYAVLYLTNSWEWSGGYAQYLEWSGMGVYPIPAQVPWETFQNYVAQFHQFGPQDSCKRMYEDHVRYIISRTNRYTNRPYSEDPAIFSWQIANEPRAFSDKNKERFFEWIDRTAKLIKELDPNHMVSTGSEGYNGCEGDIELWHRIHAIPEIDYANIHIWPLNWRWITRDSVAQKLDNALANTRQYIDEHLAIAREISKPLVIEEFGYPRDGFRFEPGSPVTARDRYYRHLFDQVVRSAAADDLLAGCNFWGWGGEARPDHLRWEIGDDYCGDPAQEEQGLNSVFDSDTTTLNEIMQTNEILDMLDQTNHSEAGNRTPASIMTLLHRTAEHNQMMFGQQDFPFYGCDWAYEAGRSDVKDCCGDYPAVLGCDLGGIELGTGANLDGVPFDTMREEIRNQYARGGLTTISWHAYNPLTGGDAWDVSSREVVASILPGGDRHETFLKWLDTVADFLNSLTTPDGAKIPVLFRPWHEHTGSWFWWGEELCTKEQYTELWRMTIGALRRHGVEMLTIYSPNACRSEAQYLDRYPGDAWIDVLGVDIYDSNEGDRYLRQMDETLTVMDQIARKRHKPYVVSETGSEGVQHPQWWTSVLLKGIGEHTPSYALVWRNAQQTLKPGHFYGPRPGHASCEDFVAFRKHPGILFASDMKHL